ncbi:MFS transporter [Paenibacillus sp. KQZ6P-2]|uniref:MFS transporter n=2 Tax=Paenibacillus mangrovi TaxID=2931978 RepID=A0A9X1WSY7_9BACL|nr:MFS transporter [Paenibacillus mangrovi]MCJ8013033.1 MFS transporter [Paenibacillus mangrovi]
MKVSLLIFAIGVFMAALDNGIITSSLTTLIYSFGVSPTWGAWTITLYTLGLAVSVPIAGKLSDRYGRKKLFIIEVLLFGTGSLLVALSPNFTFFLIARLIQALGGGGIFVIASSYVLATFPKERHGRSLGMLGGMNGIASVLGPNIGSFILGATGNWHWLFLINVPIAILLLIFGVRFIKEEQEHSQAKMDWSGISVLILGVLSLMYSFTNLDGVNVIDSLLSWKFYVFFLAAIVLFVIFYFMEKRLQHSDIEPVVPVQLLQQSTFRWALLIAFFSGAILASVIFLPGFLEQYMDVSSTVAGYWFTPVALAAGIGAAGGGFLVDKKGPTWTIALASCFSIFGFLLFALWVQSIWQMIVAGVFVGVGFGSMLGAPVNVLVTEEAGEKNKGIAVATSSLSRQLAMSIAPTIFAGFLARSFMNIGSHIQQGFAESGIQVPADLMQKFASKAGAAGDYHSIHQAFLSVPDEGVRNVLLNALHVTVKEGYNGLFWSALIFSVLSLGSALILGAIRRKKAAKLQAGRA